MLGTRWVPYGQFNGPRMGGPHGRQLNSVLGRHMGYTWVTWAVHGLHYFLRSSCSIHAYIAAQWVERPKLKLFNRCLLICSMFVLLKIVITQLLISKDNILYLVYTVFLADRYICSCRVENIFMPLQ